MNTYYSADLNAWTPADENGYPIGRYWYDSESVARHPFMAFYTGPDDLPPRVGMRAFPCPCTAPTRDAWV